MKRRDVLVPTGEAAKLLGLSRKALAARRARGTGPKFRDYGGNLILYRLTDLDAWKGAPVEFQHERRSGSEEARRTT